MMGAKEVSETAREREVFKYYQPTVLPKPEGPALFPQSSRDATLTAFAQLGALRLDAKRGMISLVSRELQYVIAEATRTLSLRSDAVYESADELWKGETIIRKRDEPCSVAMDLFTGVVKGNRDHLLVSDLSTDDRFSHMGPVTGSPFMKFYAAVPLLSVKGLVVGTFYVVDDKPRDGLSDAEIAFLKDVASTIMAHLEAKRVKQQHQRAERMIRGLGLYVEGKSSLREWWLNTGHKTDDLEVAEKIRRGESLTQQANEEFGVQDVPDDLATAAIETMSSSLEQGHFTYTHNDYRTPMNNAPSKPRPHFGQDDRSENTTASAMPSGAPDTTFTKPLGYSNSTRTRGSSTSCHESVQDTPQNVQSHSADPVDERSGARLQEAVLSNEVKESFSRASNLIRESMAVDGALFVDASIGTFGGSLTKSNIRPAGPGTRNDQNTLLTTSSSDEARQRGGMGDASSQKTCGILGYSTSTRSSLNMHEPLILHSSVTETFLRKLLRRYPHGKVFNFDDEGSLSSSEEEIRRISQNGIEVTSEEQQAMTEGTMQRRQKKKKISRKAEGKEILRLLPSARCVAFFPLWDSHKERWFAGSMVWTTNPTRVLDPDEDLTYLASFGNSIMADVSRLNALVSSQIKNSFVSSISHELRSPLHGVLASVEFLQESPLNALQQEMVNIIGSCGRTLLDTLNHVLDFTKLKITKEHKDPRSKSPSGPKPTRMGSLTSDSQSIKREAPVDLCILTEEVLQGVYAGRRFGRGPSGSLASDVSLPAPQLISPMVIVNFDWRENWRFGIHPGAWRRLVMNIFGNALKYTDAGFVRISLGSSVRKGSSNDASSSMVTLTVADSGKGISREFLNHHLYTPFTQEDSLAMGSGLGLSIVRHIVTELEGHIAIESEQDFGTEVTISLPLTPAMSPATSPGEEDLIFQVRKRAQGVTMCLVGFDIFPNIVDEPTGILSMEAKQMFYFRDSLTALLKEWFGMKVIVGASLNSTPAKISFITESTFTNLFSADWNISEEELPPRKKPVLLVLCTTLFSSHPTAVHGPFEVIYVQQPIGPQKLANILATCLPPEDENFTSSIIQHAEKGVPKNIPIEARSSPTTPLPQQPSPPLRKSSPRSQVVSNAPAGSPSPSATLSMLETSGKSILDTAMQSSVPTRTLNPTGKKGSHHVLLVEDNEINLKLLVTYMKKLGIEYVTAENGLLAVREYKSARQKFNVVLMDISMPVMDGLEASRQIRVFEKESGQDCVPIVALTGAASESVRQEAFSAGIDQFLTKPVSLKVLREVIEAYTRIS